MQGDPVQKQIYFTEITTHPKWKSEILPLLMKFQDGKLDNEQILDQLFLCNIKYCWRRKVFGHSLPVISYRALLDLYREELPLICKLFATGLVMLKPDRIFLLMGQKDARVNYSKKQIVYILLLMFFSLTPKQYSDSKQFLTSRFNHQNNFSYILSNNYFKTQCIVEYLKVAVKQLLIDKKNDEIFTIVRKIQENPNLQEIISVHRQKKMKRLNLEENDQSIQSFNGEIKIDFANRFIGGGCLRDGCVQEEIMFAIRPELYATTLLCQKMEDNQALAFIGFKRYFDYEGYGDTTRFKGFANVEYKIDNAQTEEYIVAIDAIKFKPRSSDQFQKKLIDREILKAYLGFAALPIERSIVTGGWGCGVYHGDIQTKLLIQWIAASLANKQIVFCPFGRKKFLEHELLDSLKEKTIEFAYKLLTISANMKCSPKYEKMSIFSLTQTARTHL